MSGHGTRATRLAAALPTLRAVTAFLAITIARSALAQTGSLPDYPRESQFLLDTPGTTRSIAGGLFNPAVWAVQGHGGLFFAGDSLGAGGIPQRASTFVVSTGGLGFTRRAFVTGGSGVAEQTLTDYSLGLGFGGRAGALGFGYGWSEGHNIAALRHERFTLGTVMRPNRYVSVGLAQTWDLNQRGHTFQGDLGVRPFGPRLTLFGDVSRERGDRWKDAQLGYGAELRPLPGLSIAGKARGTGGFSVAVAADLLRGVRGTIRSQYDTDGNHLQDGYSVELGTRGRALTEQLAPRARRIVEIDLGRVMTYQRFRLFDDRTAFFGVLSRLARMADDPSVHGVVVKLSRASIPGAQAWQLHEQLRRLQARGKTVTVYADDLDFTTYLVAASADRLWLDPQGSVMLEGLAMGRTFYHDAIAKMGIGFDEWRFFTYKSAMESFSRTTMSPADSTQRQNFVDDAYAAMADAICASRGLSRAAFDGFVDRQVYARGHAAVAAGLADTTGSYADARADARRVTARVRGAASPLAPLGGSDAFASDEWGARDRIALLYAIGPCDMDTGIRGRALSRALHAAAEDRTVKAVVLCVDSPGGDPLPSDLVAREIRALTPRKPVVVSQGALAGSGGYWISMDATRILATPVTITGSIGVIGGWFWDKKASAKLGLTYDGVQHGAHADMSRGVTFPLVGATLPQRQLTGDERGIIETQFRTMYGEFVGAVARGRHMTPDAVDTIGQGHFFSGVAGRRIGLVDSLGGLWEAMEAARDLAGLSRSREVEVVQGPQRGAINPDAFKVSPLAANASAWLPAMAARDREFYVRLLGSAGAPCVMMLPLDAPGLLEP